MSRTLIICHSKTGFTQRYAGWIAQRLQADVVPYRKRNGISFGEYDTVIYGGGMRAGFIGGMAWFKKQKEALAGKKVIVFATGAAPADSPEAVKALAQNLAGTGIPDEAAFYFQSGLCYEKMGLRDRMMMKMFCVILRKAEGESAEYKMMLTSFDRCSEEAVRPLTEYAAQS